MTTAGADTIKYTFSGHDSFQCRQLWLKKGYDYIQSKKSFNDEDAVVKLGVGKNMVSAIRYWMKAFNIIDSKDKPTEFGIKLFDDKTGYDPFLEDDASLWLLHYQLIKIGIASTYSIIFNEFRKEKLFFNKDFLNEIATKFFPLDILSANILTLSLQRYGQNERSLFSFLESKDHIGRSKFNKRENPFYNLNCVYDYLNFNFYSFLTSKYNPDFSAWSSIRSSLEEVERAFDSNINDYAKAIKVIGLLNIFSASGAILDEAFLSSYLENACGVSDASKIIENLEEKRIIRFRSHSKRYILFDGTDLDIQRALIEAGNKISEVGDVTTLLNNYLGIPLPLQTHKANTQEVSGYPLQSFFLKMKKKDFHCYH